MELLLDRAAVAPPTGAALFSVTVQVVAEPATKLVGLQISEVTLGGAVRETDTDCDTPPRVAVSVAG